jgi:hypothetical protein
MSHFNPLATLANNFPRNHLSFSFLSFPRVFPADQTGIVSCAVETSIVSGCVSPRYPVTLVDKYTHLSDRLTDIRVTAPSCYKAQDDWEMYSDWLHVIGISIHSLFLYVLNTSGRQWRTEGGWGVQPPEILKVLQNHAKLNPIVKTVKNCWI